MSVGPMSSYAGSIAGAPLAQTKGADVERSSQDTMASQRLAQGELKAEAAAGIGETDGQEHGTNDRDADGRLPWKISRPDTPSAAAEEQPPTTTAPPPDPSRQSGTLLDLSG
jgi:hypothetical protein